MAPELDCAVAVLTIVYLQRRYIGIYYVSDTMYPIPRIQGGESPMQTQMVKWGNSLAVRIPKAVVEEARLKEGDSLEI
jgi:hypothetical protein